jgi:hypothetical protein
MLTELVNPVAKPLSTMVGQYGIPTLVDTGPTPEVNGHDQRRRISIEQEYKLDRCQSRGPNESDLINSTNKSNIISNKRHSSSPPWGM